MDISLQGYGHKTVTLLAGTTDLVAGEPVSISDNYEVSRAISGDALFGICANVDGDYVSVITSGVIELPYSGTTTIAGLVGLCCAGSGAMKKDSDSYLYYQVLNVDSVNDTITFIL